MDGREPMPGDELLPDAPPIMDREVPDYGPGGWLQARLVDPPHTLVWCSEHRDLALSWALVLEAAGVDRSRLRVRLRISRRLGRRAPWLIEPLAHTLDWATARVMIAGLRERIAAGAGPDRLR
ncbi:MAG: hypothetical protein ACR2OB_09245 [Solirubrobacteraceae bacterium]